MDSSRFDTLVRLVSEDASRRGVLKSAFALIGAGLGLTSLFDAEEAAAKKSCKKKCKKKKTREARRKCKKKCQKQDPNNGGQKQPGALCDNTSECAPPFICALPLNDSGGDERCCGASGAPCGGDNIDLDDQPPICCQGFVCSTNDVPNGGAGACQPAP